MRHAASARLAAGRKSELVRGSARKKSVRELGLDGLRDTLGMYPGVALSIGIGHTSIGCLLLRCHRRAIVGGYLWRMTGTERPTNLHFG